MIKNYILFLSLFSITLFSAEYDVGDMVDLDDQNENFNVCNGEYYSNDFKLSHINGDLNGGHYFVSWFDISATW